MLSREVGVNPVCVLLSHGYTLSEGLFRHVTPTLNVLRGLILSRLVVFYGRKCEVQVILSSCNVKKRQIFIFV